MSSPVPRPRPSWIVSSSFLFSSLGLAAAAARANDHLGRQELVERFNPVFEIRSERFGRAPAEREHRLANGRRRRRQMASRRNVIQLVTARSSGMVIGRRAPPRARPSQSHRQAHDHVGPPCTGKQVAGGSEAIRRPEFRAADARAGACRAVGVNGTSQRSAASGEPSGSPTKAMRRTVPDQVVRQAARRRSVPARTLSAGPCMVARRSTTGRRVARGLHDAVTDRLAEQHRRLPDRQGLDPAARGGATVGGKDDTLWPSAADASS